jgi:hypothetical protein
VEYGTKQTGKANNIHILAFGTRGRTNREQTFHQILVFHQFRWQRQLNLTCTFPAIAAIFGSSEIIMMDTTGFWMCVTTVFSIIWVSSGACPDKCICSGTTYQCGKTENITESDLITIFAGTPSNIKRLAINNYLGDTLKFVQFRLIPNIEYFYILNSKALTMIEENAFNGVRFQSLTISNTRISELPNGVFQPIKNTLWYLELDNNEVTTFSDKIFKGLTNIQYLYLNRNKIRTIAPSVFTSVKTATIRIQQNPVDCSCAAAPVALWEWLNADQSLKIDIKCATPSSVSGKSLHQLNESEICPPTKTPSPDQTPRPTQTSVNVTSFPDWAIVLVVAGIFTVMLLISGILCQFERRRYYAQQKKFEELQGSQPSSIEEVYRKTRT